MPQLIETVQIEEEKPLELEDPATLAAMPWREYLRRANYNQDPDKMCQECIANQKKKFGGDTPIICKGYSTYKERLKDTYGDVLDEVEKHLTQDEIDTLNAEFDPVTWFKINSKDPSKIQARYYQEMMLRCTAKNISLRMGRRCVAEDELVWMGDGSFKKIQDVKIGDEVLSHREGSIVKNKVLDVIDNGRKEVMYKIHLRDGKQVTVTSDHEILTKDGWKSLDTGLSEKDFVYSVNKYSLSEYNDISPDQAKLLGYLLTDGYLAPGNQTPKFTSSNYKYIEECQELAKKLFDYDCTIKKRTESEAWDIWFTDGIKGSKNKLKRWAESLDICSPKYKFKNSVELISKMSPESLAEFLNRAWAGDGCISLTSNPKRPKGKRVESSLTSGDNVFIKTLLNVLQREGVEARIDWNKPRKVTHQIRGRGIKSAGINKVRFSSGTDVKNFLSLTGSIYGKENQSLEALSEIEKRSALKGKSVEEGLHVSRIKKIEKIEREVNVWDLTVENDHNFIANGIVVHNCGKSFSAAMKVLHKIATSKNPIEVLVVAPQITMINEIVQTLEALIDNLSIPDFLVSKKSQPIVEMKFFNGSLLKGITSGTDGKAARGKRADLIWIDEVDFVVTKAMDAIKGVQLDNPNVEMIYTSTPIGQGNLYAFAQLPITREFHYPTFANPSYTDEMHETIKDMSDTAYCQELLAVFGVDEAGVFPVSLVDKAFEFNSPEIYNENFVFQHRDRFIIFIGVDWNHDNNGTRIVVVAYDKLTDRFFVLDKYKVAKLQMTQALAVERVIEANRKYDADHILCDEGFGAAQISQLRLKGEEQYGKVPTTHPDIKLVDTIGVNFGSTLTVTDPVTKELLKRNTKQYIVENTQKLLEDKKLALRDVEDEDLATQMKNYHVANKGLRGNIYKPKNKKIGDHDLDAYMLALYGFNMFYSGFIKPTMIDHASIINTSPRYEAEVRDLGIARFKSSFKSGGVRRAKRRTF